MRRVLAGVVAVAVATGVLLVPSWSPAGSSPSGRAPLDREMHAYGEGGFYDAVAVRSGTIAKRYLSLDQAMVMGSIGNVFGNDVIRRAFATGEVARRIRPLIAMEQFGAGLS